MTMTRPELLAAYRSALDALDAINAEKSRAQAEADRLESAIRAELESSGEWQPGCGIKAPGMTVNVVQKWRAKYDPSLWPTLIAWAGEHGASHLVQRRLNDKAVLEMHDNGQPLPDGLTLEAFLDLTFRRGC